MKEFYLVVSVCISLGTLLSSYSWFLWFFWGFSLHFFAADYIHGSDYLSLCEFSRVSFVFVVLHLFCFAGCYTLLAV